MSRYLGKGVTRAQLIDLFFGRRINTQDRSANRTSHPSFEGISESLMVLFRIWGIETSFIYIYNHFQNHLGKQQLDFAWGHWVTTLSPRAKTRSYPFQKKRTNFGWLYIYVYVCVLTVCSLPILCIRWSLASTKNIESANITHWKQLEHSSHLGFCFWHGQCICCLNHVKSTPFSLAWKKLYIHMIVFHIPHCPNLENPNSKFLPSKSNRLDLAWIQTPQISKS